MKFDAGFYKEQDRLNGELQLAKIRIDALAQSTWGHEDGGPATFAEWVPLNNKAIEQVQELQEALATLRVRMPVVSLGIEDTMGEAFPFCTGA